MVLLGLSAPAQARELALHAPKPVVTLTLTRPDGTTLTTEEFRGKVLIVNFWASWCGPCIQEMPALAALQEKYGEEGLAVLPASQDAMGSKPFYQEQLDLPVLYDVKSMALNEIGGRGLPTTLILDREGREVARVEGALEWMSEPSLEKIESVLKSKD